MGELIPHSGRDPVLARLHHEVDPIEVELRASLVDLGVWNRDRQHDVLNGCHAAVVVGGTVEATAFEKGDSDLLEAEVNEYRGLADIAQSATGQQKVVANGARGAAGQDKGEVKGRRRSNWSEKREIRAPPQRPVLRPNATGGRAHHHPRLARPRTLSRTYTY